MGREALLLELKELSFNELLEAYIEAKSGNRIYIEDLFEGERKKIDDTMKVIADLITD